jgi:hypothetical protein
MKPELMKNWLVVQNGKRLDIHAIDPLERREITVVADVRDEACAWLIANAPKYKEALEKIIAESQLADGESLEPKAQKMFDLAFSALGLENQSESL